MLIQETHRWGASTWKSSLTYMHNRTGGVIASVLMGNSNGMPHDMSGEYGTGVAGCGPRAGADGWDKEGWKHEVMVWKGEQGYVPDIYGAAEIAYRWEKGSGI